MSIETQKPATLEPIVHTMPVSRVETSENDASSQPKDSPAGNSTEDANDYALALNTPEGVPVVSAGHRHQLLMGLKKSTRHHEEAEKSKNPFPVIGRAVKNFFVGEDTSQPEPAVTETAHAPDYSSIKTPVPVAAAAPIVSNAQAFLQAHGDGHANLNLRDEAANRMAATIAEAERDPRFAGKIVIISALRDEQEQRALLDGYAIRDSHGRVTGYRHPVGAADGPNHSRHLDGDAIDIAFKGNKKDEAAFFAAYHQIGAKNGLTFVAGDINHAQYDEPRIGTPLQQAKGNVQMAVSQKFNTNIPST